MGASILATPFSPPFTTLVTIFGGFGACLEFLAFSLLAFDFVTLTFLYVTFILAVKMFATVTTGDGTLEVILIVHCFSIFGVLLSFQLQHAATAMIAVRGMTRPPFVIDRFTVEWRGYTCFRLHLIHGT